MFWVKNAQAIEKKRDELPRSAKSEGKSKRAASEERYGDAVQRAVANNTKLTGNPYKTLERKTIRNN
jgi:hypothetical protein